MYSVCLFHTIEDTPSLDIRFRMQALVFNSPRFANPPVMNFDVHSSRSTDIFIEGRVIRWLIESAVVLAQRAVQSSAISESRDL